MCVCACACVWRWLCQKPQASNVHPHKYVESHYWVAIMAFHIICGPLEPRRDQICSECQWERGSVMPANIHLISTWMFNEIVVEYSLTRFETLQTVINLSLSLERQSRYPNNEILSLRSSNSHCCSLRGSCSIITDQKRIEENQLWLTLMTLKLGKCLHQLRSIGHANELPWLPAPLLNLTSLPTAFIEYQYELRLFLSSSDWLYCSLTVQWVPLELALPSRGILQLDWR